MSLNRQERTYRAGIRVRFDAPGYGFHGETGTVARDTEAHAALFVLRDGRALADAEVVCGTAEVARLRDQTENPAHRRPDGCEGWSFWWKRDAGGVKV